MRKWYQNVPVEGAVYEDPKRKDSKFWNEGKWRNFVEPLLPAVCRTFIEIGCNAGLFLKLAQDEGAVQVIGIEGSSRVMRQAELFRESINGNYKLVLQQVGKNLALDQLPLADVVLFSNTHYYFPVNDFAKLVDELRYKALYCIIVSARGKRRGGKAFYDLQSVRGYFRDWTEIGTVEGIETAGDPTPREGMYSVLFQGGLHSLNLRVFYDRWRKDSIRSEKHRFHALPPALEEFFGKVFSEEEFDFEETLLYQYWRTREPRYPASTALKRLAQKKALAEDVQANGIRDPVYFDHRGNLIDGLHRMCIAKALGYEHILVRRL
jgi:hypothetical protein